MPKTKIDLKLHFISNVPLCVPSPNLTLIQTEKKNIKYFIYFICFYNLFFKKTFLNFTLTKPKLVSFPLEKKVFTLLRAPFRHKLSKKNYVLVRYKSSIYYQIELYDFLFISKIDQLIDIKEVILKYVHWFETNVQYLAKINLNICIKMKKYKL